MQSLYVEKNIPRIALTKALATIRSDAYFSRLSPMKLGQIDGRLPGPRWVRVENKLAGICGTDLLLVYADVDLRVAPAALPSTNRIYLGHEIVGHVTEIGPDVTTLAVGDRVALRFMYGSCLSEEMDLPCRYCAEGNAYLCENAAECKSNPLGGGWGQAFVAHETQLFRVPEGLSDEEVVLIEPAAVGVHAVLRRPPGAGQRALVLGCGIIGLLTLQAARAVAAEAEIVAVARHPHQAEAARRLGANHVITDTQDIYGTIAGLTGARRYKGSFGNQVLVGGFDVIYDCVGNARTIEDALRWTRAGGTVVVVGIDLNRLKLDLTPIWYREVDLIGSLANGTETWNGQRVSTFELTARWFAEGKLTADGLITHRFPLADYREAIETATDKSRRSIKVVFDIAHIK
jgi:2-desacetyl-2-hydroxyethyl bacteriochlorophyllide A dehydrogenase